MLLSLLFIVNLLFLTPQLPHPPRQGTAIRNWGLIKSLSARHTITLLTFAASDESISDELRAACQQVETVPPPQRSKFRRLVQLFSSPLPDLAHRLYSPECETKLNALLQSQAFDAIFIEGLELARYLINNQSPVSSRQSGTTNYHLPLTLFDAHNCETVLQRRAYETDLRNPRRWPVALYSRIQTGRLATFEAKVCRRVTHVTCVSREDAAALTQLAPTVQPIVVPNGLFLTDYPNLQSPVSSSPREASAPQLVFTGKMDYRPNVDAVLWFANDILPHIQRERPEAQFVIVGQKPTEAVQKLAERKGIVVTGAVDDVQPHIARAAVYVAPLRMGGGTRFKLLEAMTLKRPIVSTRIGAEGFEVQSGRELLLADSPADFAQAVLALLSDNAKQAALIGAAYEFVKRYDWGEIIPTVEAVLAKGKG